GPGPRRGARPGPGLRPAGRRRRRSGRRSGYRTRQPRGDPRAAGPTRDQRRGRRHGDPGAREDPLMTTTRDATLLLDHPIGKRGRVAIRLASAEVRLVAEDGDRVSVHAAGGALPDRVVIEPVDGAVTVRELEDHGLTFGSDRKSV